ncbi:MAG TPA: maltose alpha-D-glucosyltransferase [Tepidisphaeraceae bacterium]
MSKAKTLSRSKAAAGGAAGATAMPVDPTWYRNAVIYQMHVRSFQDSNGDGIGDFPGLISRLDYLEELGVTAIWLLPFYPSPLKDDGYDIADYTSVNPSYGTIDEVRQFIDEAHRRQIRVVTELVINHTSDQHAWFQRARRAPKGSPERDFYVWSDTPDKYNGVRIIFKDFEPSNWTFDHVAGQYYWHRFFHHQPDLNFDNTAVHDAVLKVCDFWMTAGVDGVRLDAVPYLYEREGTSCENLPETHDFLKKLRKHVDDFWPGRMLLAEANQWPEDAIAYFGDDGKGRGDECHMNFHFPLMPRLFMSLRMEDRNPIIDILEQTPALPEGAQWAMFLRNHDELTLEMVTDEERDYMWRVYASDPAARINMGIRRRLAPLLENSRRKIELMNALLFSMPGTPVIYYGDEIGMGDNIFLGDRNGVRTPMQWSGDRNAGFSRANPQRLFLPVIIDPEYHAEALNVESQMTNPSSLLWWMRRLIALRKSHPVLGHGEIRFLAPSNPKVLAFLRSDAQQQILVVANLARFAQPVELDLPEFAGATPVEMFGNVRFPAIGEDGRCTLSVGPHGFYWFVLEPATPPGDDTGLPPEVRVNTHGDVLLTDPAFNRMLAGRLPRLLPTRRWFVSKAKSLRGAHVIARLPLESADESSTSEHVLFLVEVEFTEGEAETYAMPLSATLIDPDGDSPSIESGVLRVTDGSDRQWIVRDGMADADFARALLSLAVEGREIAGHGVRLVGRRIEGADAEPIDVAGLTPKLPDREQSNTNVLFGDQLILKLYRRLGEGLNPELEIGEHLTAKAGFTNTAPLAGAIEFVGRGHRQTLAVVLTFVPNQGDAWGAFLDHGQRYFEGVAALTPQQASSLCLPGDPGCSGGDEPPPADVASLIAEPLELARLIGRRTAEMHTALADDRGDPAFAPEPYSAVYQRGLLQSMRNTTRAAMQTLAKRVGTLGGEARTMAEALMKREPEVLALFRELTSRPIKAPRIRVHGDYHLGQVLWTGKDFVIIDFEGEPLRSVGERRLKRSSFRDVAGMVRSFDYAAWTALRRHWELLPPDSHTRDRDTRGAKIWGTWLGHEFVRAYTTHLRGIRPDLLPAELADSELVLRSWVLEKALYEVRYELNSRPDWVDIPLQAVLAILDAPGGATTAVGGVAAGSSASTPGNTPGNTLAKGSANGHESPRDLQTRKERGQ